MANTISQRIALEGGDDVKKQLLELGAAGEKAVNEISTVAEASGSKLAAVSRTVNQVFATFGKAKEQLAPVGEAFANLHSHVSNFGSQLSNVANNIFPHFKEVLAIGTLASVAGMFQLAEAAVRGRRELELNARSLGISVGALKAWSRAATEAGIEQDQLVQALQRFEAEVQKTTEETDTLLLKAVQAVVGADRLTAAGGVNILRGHADAVQDVLTNTAAAAEKSGKQIAEVSGRLIQISGGDAKIARKLAEEEWSRLSEGAKKGIGSLRALINANTAALQANGDVAKTLRETASKIGFGEASKTVFAEIEQQIPGFKKTLVDLGLTVDDLKGKNLEEIFPKFLDAFAKAPLFKQNAVAIQLFGRAGRDLVPLLQEGSAALTKYASDFAKIGVNLGPAGAELNAMHGVFIKFNSTLKIFKDAIGIGFAQAISPLLGELNNLGVEVRPQLIAFATALAQSVIPVIRDFIAVIKSGGQTEVQNAWVLNVVNAIRSIDFNAIKQGFVGFFTFVQDVFTGIANLINRVFGTDFNATTVAVVVVLGTLTGAFTAIASIVGVLAAGVTALIAVIGALATPVGAAVLAFAGLAAGIGALIVLFQDQLVVALQTVGGWFDWLGSKVSEIVTSIIGWITPLFDLIARAISALSSLAAAGQQAEVDAAPKFASGGFVSGPSGIDKVSARLTAGEYVVRNTAVNFYGPRFFAALNALTLPRSITDGIAGLAARIVPSRRFAEGGMVPAVAGGGTPVHLHIGGQTFPLSGDSDVVEALTVEANRHKIRSAGVKPGWFAR